MTQTGCGCSLPIGFTAFVFGLLLWAQYDEIIWAFLGFATLVGCYLRSGATERDE